MSDAEHAAVLRRLPRDSRWLKPEEWAAIERAIELLEGAADLEYVCPDIYPKDLDG